MSKETLIVIGDLITYFFALAGVPPVFRAIFAFFEK